MAATRKLQGEIDRCLKKVGEGVEKFEDTWQKFHSASNPNQKEKYEDDLKKEIKKLQRLRDQIKTWITSAEIKDKSSLLERRKLIEMKMEQFKVVERETKTKAYSKEGLTSGAKRDPAEKERRDVSQWLNGCLETLKIQIDMFEAEIEGLQTAKKKKKNEASDKIEEYNTLLRKHRDHVQKLETLLRMLDNETVEISQIWLIKDDVEYYIENHMEQDFIENELIYTEIDGLQEMLLDIGGSEHRDQPLEGLLENTLSSSVNSVSSSVQDQSSTSSAVTPVTSTSSSTPTSTSKATSITSKPTTNSVADNTTASSPPAASVLQSSSTTPKPLPAPVLSSSSVFSTLVSTPAKPPVPPIPFAAVASAAPNAKVSNSTTNPGITAQTSNLLNFDVSNATANGRNTPTPTSSTATANFATAFRNGHMSGPSPGPSRIPQDGFPLGAPVPKAFAAVAGNTYNSSSDALPSLKSIAQKATVDAGLPVPLRQSLPPTQSQPQQQPPPQQQQNDPISASLSHGLYQGSQAKDLSHKTEATVPPLLGVAPLGPVPLTKETQMQLTMLEAASRHMPHPSDSERLRPYLPRNPCSTPPYYPQLPPEGSDRIEFFQRLSTETLFFIFYYMEGTKAQYLAASALKKQSWRFHTKYMMWFQRHEEPKVINDEYEQGTYIYFDFEKWGQRKKEGFTFEYRFLEDRELN